MAKTVSKTPVYDDTDGLLDEVEQAVNAHLKSEEQPSTPEDARAQLDNRLVGAIEMLAKNVAQQRASEPVRQIPFSKVKINTPWHPSGERKRPKLSRPTFQNGKQVREMFLSNQEIEKFNALTPGHYCNRRVVVWSKDTSDGIASINIQFPHKTLTEKIEMQHLSGGRGIEGILDSVLNEAKTPALAS